MLLTIHLFNLAGYTLLFDYFIQQSDQQLIQQLEAHQYNDHELIEVKIALHTPYLSSWSHYEQVNGEAEVNGIYYTYVKRKVHNDTLFLLCVPNKNKTQLNAARIEYANNVQDVPASTKNTLKKNPAGFEYQQPVARLLIRTIPTAIQQPFHHVANSASQIFISGPYNPPRV
ncbi:MAG TPA: hypothetical protein VM187_10270 [Niastella sp.]|nr:hypothetical protein [Niastella sp.]